MQCLVLMKAERVEELQRWIERLNLYGRDDYLQDYIDKRAKILTAFVNKLIKSKRYDKDAKTTELLQCTLRVFDAEKALAKAIVGSRRHVAAFAELIAPTVVRFPLQCQRPVFDSVRARAGVSD